MACVLIEISKLMEVMCPWNVKTFAGHILQLSDPYLVRLGLTHEYIHHAKRSHGKRQKSHGMCAY